MPQVSAFGSDDGSPSPVNFSKKSHPFPTFSDNDERPRDGPVEVKSDSTGRSKERGKIVATNSLPTPGNGDVIRGIMNEIEEIGDADLHLALNDSDIDNSQSVDNEEDGEMTRIVDKI